MATAISKVKKDMTSGKILPQLIFFAFPIIATNVLQLLFNTADTIVVGRWGGDTKEACEQALAAVGSCGALINLLIGLFTGLSVGAGVSVSHAMGAKNYKLIEKIVHTSSLTAIFCGTLASIIGLIFARPLLVLMGTEAKVLDQAVLYMRAYFCGIPANMLYTYCASMLRSTGDSTRPLIFLSSAGVVNVILNLITVLAFGLGAVGVGIATAASHWVSCILIVIYMLRTDDPCHLEFKKLHIDLTVLRKILAIGIPAGVSGSVFSVSNVIIQSSINSFDSTAIISGNSVGANIGQYALQTVNSISQATLTFVGQNVGAGKTKRVKQGVLWSILMITIVGLALSILIYIFSDFLLGLYAPGNDQVIAYGKMRLLYVGMFYFICGLQDCGSSAMRGLGRSTTSMIISLIGACGFRVLWIYTAFAHFKMLEIIYISFPISWILTSVTQFGVFAFEFRKFKKTS